jgi:Flp pilus assembly protein TadG
MSGTSKATTRLKRFSRFGRWRRDENGFTAVEFAMVIGPFLALLFAIIEVGMTEFIQSSFVNAVAEASRNIRTGLVQKEKMTVSEFQSRICSNLPPMVSCSDIIIDVRNFGTFAEASANAPAMLDADGNLIPQSAATYDPGGPNDIVLVTVSYRWPLMASLPSPRSFIGTTGLGFGNMADGSRLVSSSLAFRNEPFI